MMCHHRRGAPLTLVFLLAAAASVRLAVAGIATPKGEKEYGEDFFQQHLENAPAYALLVRTLSSLGTDMQEELSNISVLDVGCGHGLLVEAWRAAGVAESYGIEGSSNAAPLWPESFKDKYYILQDLEASEARYKIRKTDYVTSFEVAEHISPERADHFVGLLTMHRPRRVFFGAATPFQDRGMNPSHVNENTFRYWIERFADHGYHVDWAKTARARHLLVTPSDMEEAKAMWNAWWYPKKILVFAPNEDWETTDRALLDHPKEADMLNPVYLDIRGTDEFGELWRRDWREFGTLFYEKQEATRQWHSGKTGRGEL